MTSTDLIDMAHKLDELAEDATWMADGEEGKRARDMRELANEAYAAAAKLRLVAGLWNREVSRANGGEV